MYDIAIHNGLPVTVIAPTEYISNYTTPQDFTRKCAEIAYNAITAAVVHNPATQYTLCKLRDKLLETFSWAADVKCEGKSGGIVITFQGRDSGYVMQHLPMQDAFFRLWETGNMLGVTDKSMTTEAVYGIISALAFGHVPDKTN